MASPTSRGRFVWHELLTTDPKAASRFYEEVIGWKAQSWEKDPSYTLLMAGGRPMAGTMELPPEAKAMQSPPFWTVYITSPNVDVTAREVVELGGKVLRPAADIPDIG